MSSPRRIVLSPPGSVLPISRVAYAVIAIMTILQTSISLNMLWIESEREKIASSSFLPRRSSRRRAEIGSAGGRDVPLTAQIANVTS
uniref:Col_cuticle_N domain-containing protein n=1 Tax=Steinernema glaseri TaxID=37863 RepID=A0A1I7ZUZ7_9BILA